MTEKQQARLDLARPFLNQMVSWCVWGIVYSGQVVRVVETSELYEPGDLIVQPYQSTNMAVISPENAKVITKLVPSYSKLG